MNSEKSLEVCLAELPTPEGLYTAVLGRIVLARRRGAAVRLAGLLVVVLGSGAALISALRYAGEEFYDSGFYDYLSLVLSDHTFVLSSWREFSYSLIESLPSLALLMLAACAAAFIWSAWRAMYQAKVAFRFV
jgi:hypothetical protein